MSTLEMAWEAFQAAVAEAQAMHASGANGAAIQDLLPHARELLDIIADELLIAGITLSKEAYGGIEQLRERLSAIEMEFFTRH